jgi:hypothetical protein
MLPSRWFLALVLVAAPARLAVGSPIAISVGGALRIPLSEAPHALDEPFDEERGKTADGTTPVGTLDAMIGYRVSSRIAIGVRSAVSWRSYRTHTHPLHDEFHDSFSEIPVDVALATELEAARVGSDTFWVTPWLGRRFTRESHSSVYCVSGADSIFTCNPSKTFVHWRSTGNVLGVTTGLDFPFEGTSGQVSIFVEAQVASENGSALGVGLAFRR